MSMGERSECLARFWAITKIKCYWCRSEDAHFERVKHTVFKSSVFCGDIDISECFFVERFVLVVLGASL